MDKIDQRLLIELLRNEQRQVVNVAQLHALARDGAVMTVLRYCDAA